MEERIIRVGHSPDPDDAFMFYGLAAEKVKLPGIRIEHVMEDIQSLNVRAASGELEVTAISAHSYPYVADKYWIMKTGASMGEGYGPVIVSRRYRSLEELRGKVVATPGELTTATLLFRLFTAEIEMVNIPFDEIMGRVAAGEFAAGLLIHEGQLTYKQEGFHKILDFGELWAKETGGLPLPLGLDVVRKDLGLELAVKLCRALQESIEYGYHNQEESIPYALKWGRGIDAEKGARFVKMYVNELTLDMGDTGRQDLERLFTMAADSSIISKKPELVII